MLIEARGLSKRYGARGPLVVEAISFSIDRGETLSIFGDSGSGKSTIGQMLAGLFPPTAGEILLDGLPLTYPFRGRARRRIQMLFQHPEVSFDPRMSLAESMGEPCRFAGRPRSRDWLEAYLEPYGIYAEHLDRRPAQLSGGELQRLALARAMLMEPDLLVLDEPTSMLDVISQAQIVGLLRSIQRERGLGCLFISHDYLLCKALSTSIQFLRQGRLTPQHSRPD